MRPLHKRTSKVEDIFRAYTMTRTEVELIVGALLLACAKHCDPVIVQAIREEFDDILSRFWRSEQSGGGNEK